MKVVTIITPAEQERYLLVNSEGVPVESVTRFLRFKDNAGKQRNTLRAYCHHLKSFFEFLAQTGRMYHDIGIDEMAAYIWWLHSPHRNTRIVPFHASDKTLQPATVNTYLSTIISFYDYLGRIEDPQIGLAQRTRRQVINISPKYKDMLYHTHKSVRSQTNILKLKEPKKNHRSKILQLSQVHILIDACRNVRDAFLLRLLWETGFRIGECLALWLEDFEIDAYRIELKDRGNLENKAEIKTITSPRIVDVSPELMNAYLDYLADYHTDEVGTNHVFIKLSGANSGTPMNYPDVAALFRRLQALTGIHVTPHMFRHTHFDTLRKNGWGFEKIQKRGGWADIQTPMQIYSHPDEEELRKEWEKTQKIFLNRGDDCADHTPERR